MTYRFQLIAKSPKSGDVQLPAQVQIGLKNFPVDNGTPLVTPILTSVAEVDHHISRLIAELETLRREAKQALATR